MKRFILMGALALLCVAAAACSLPRTPPGAQEGLPACAQVVAAVLESQAFEEMTALSENQIHEALSVNDGLLADGAMSVDASMEACVAVLCAVDARSAGTAFAALSGYRDALPASGKGVGREVILERRDLYSVLIVCGDARAARAALAGVGWPSAP